MDGSIVLTLGITLGAIILFVTEIVRVDLVALIVLGALAVSGLVTPTEALSGFSNPAVVTVWAVFILSGGLSRTGVANVIGRQVLRLAGKGEVRLLAVIMISAGLMSAIMNNIGVAALLLPVVMDIARRTGRAPSKLLMPLAFGCLLGGLTTLIGTPPNILASNALREFNLRPFQFFDFTPLGLVILLVGTAFVALIGRRLLPNTDISREYSGTSRGSQGGAFGMEERLFMLHLPASSALAGKSLEDSRLGAILSLNVVGIIRDGETYFAPEHHFVLQAGDRLLVAGRLDALDELREHQPMFIQDERLSSDSLVSTEIQIVTLELTPSSELIGKTLRECDFRRRFGANALAIWREGEPLVEDIQYSLLLEGDMLVVQVSQDQIENMEGSADFLISKRLASELYRLHDRLFAISIPPSSLLVGRTLVESRLGEAYDLNVLTIIRQDRRISLPGPDEKIQSGDTLVVEGDLKDMLVLRALQELEIDRTASLDLKDLESEKYGLLEAVLSPYTSLAGKTLREIHFREKYGLSVLAIWREGRPYRWRLGEMPLRFGDALLLHGARDKLRLLASETDFLLLAEEVQEAPVYKKAPLTALLMVVVVLSVVLGWTSIAIAAVVGATAMILYGSVNMEEAYRFIDWRAVFLIAGMLPLGIAMESSGTANWVAEGMVNLIGGGGPYVLLAGLFILTSLASQFMPNAVVTVLMAPIAINTAMGQGYSPYAFIMAVAIAASAAFLSPVGHPANVLIMGPGGYRFGDYFKLGLPLTIVVLLITLLLLPVFWPLA
ncbi:MAG TPA: SLC13 family permease [Anaerolineales bacterium]|nr:SLC13 family permease [Anaerolineales bacterium]